MLRLMGWLAVSVGLIYLGFRFAVWHLAWQLAIVCSLLLWVLLGASLVGQRLRALNKTTHATPEDFTAYRAAAARAAYVAQFGEDAAKRVEGEDRFFWHRAADYREAAK